jgi:hypothetical protein
MASPSSARAMGAAGPMGFAGDARGEAGVLVGGEGSHARLSEPRTIGGGESAGHVYGGRRPVRLPSYGGEPSGGSGGDYSSSGQTLPSYGGAGSSGMPLPGSGLVGSGSLSSPSGGMVGGGGGAPASHAYHSGHSGFSSPSYSSPSYSAPVQSFHGGSGGAHISGGGGYHSSSSAGHHVGGGGHHR